MFTFCWILLFFIKGAEVREFNLTGCLHKEPERIYHAITEEEFILECVLPSQHRTHMYNNSFLYKSKVLWFWQQKDGEPLKVISNESTNPTQEGNALWFRPIGINASGVYICMISIQWTMRQVVRVKIIARNTLHSPNILSPSGMKTLEVEIGKPLKIECKVFFGFESDFLPMITWYRDNKESKSEPLLQNITRIRVEELEGKSFVHVATLKEVTERDLNSNLICFAQNSVGNSTGVLKLKRKDRALFIFILYGAIAVLVGLLVGSAFVYQHWIEIVLMYRNYLAKDETIGDHKEFDAFVSYAKQDSFERDSTFLNEEQFALEVLPEVLENKYGYKLCLLERDIPPGGAYTDDIVTAIRQSRRAIIILSPGYVNGPSIFELQAAVNCALEDNMLKLILIKYKSFQEPESLPPIVKKALKILPVVTWKSSNSNSPNKQFWKYMRYHMPVKNTRGLGKNSLKFFPHRLFSVVINSRKATGRSQQTKEIVR
ncbi:interleukin-18 receptor accessory protein isoform 2-T4 [Pangshura tecta]